MNAYEIPQADSAPRAYPPLRDDLMLAALLGVVGALATAALFPYLMQLMPGEIAQALKKVPFPLPVLVALQSLQAGVMLTALSLAGLRLGHRVGLGTPWLRAMLFRTPRIAQPWLLAAACGVLAGVAVIALDPLFAPYMPKTLHAMPPATASAHAFTGFLASFYGGIGEEIQLRLFFVTLLAWGMSKFSGNRVLRWQLVLAVVLAAVVFGLGHLPAASKVWPLDAIVIARTVLLNCIAGLVFGWFYIRHGLESAMLSHFCADLVLHVAAPLLMT